MKTTFFALVLALPLFVTACDSTDPGDGAGEGELITRVTLTFTPVGSGAVATAQFDDANRNGFVDAGEFTPLDLRAGLTYNGTITFGNAGEDLTAEVRAEAEQHQVLYTPGGGIASRLTITATDQDANGLPIGLAFRAIVAQPGAGTGTLRVVLSHYDGAAKRAGVASAEADFDGAFPVTITP